jgi:PPK2 family polyphosphate:nucleotide phosphotransferase
MSLIERLRVKPGAKANLSDFAPDFPADFASKEDVSQLLERNTKQLAALQRKLYADGRHALLIVLQAMDAGGKDGTIRRVMSGVNPQGCRVHSFKAPTSEELARDFLWRVHAVTPRLGEIGIFNRSHYEDVLVARVKNLVSKSTWSKRYDRINDFERLLYESGTSILKFFLHIGKDEQKRRLARRLEDPERNWKFSPADIEERKRWNNYMKAYEDAIGRCSTPWAPWYVIPANKKWFRNLAVSEIVVDTLRQLDLRYPKPAFDVGCITIS